MKLKERKGKKGTAAQYLTRSAALSKLQLSLADFRRLCILKGIYPRDPKKKPKGNDKAYYHIKDIKFLACEPLLDKFRSIKAFMKKVKKAMARKEPAIAKNLLDKKPTYSLHHLLKERYPTFVEALRDLDDALCTLALFASLPADQTREIPGAAVKEAQKLVEEFHFFVAKTKALRAVFVSIKGYYFQAELLGVNVTWLIPHQFSQHLPTDVDFRVLVTFLEFYRTLVKFSNFKLFQLESLTYPPLVDRQVAGLGGGFLALRLKGEGMGKKETKEEEGTMAKSAEGKEMDASMKERAEEAEAAEEIVDADEEGEGDEGVGGRGDFEDTEEAKIMKEQEERAKRQGGLFSSLKVFINREIPKGPVAFVLQAGGASVGWAAPGSPFDAKDPDITHQIVDRPLEGVPEASEDVGKRREFVQPQWAFDSFNCAALLPVGAYAAGKRCPPHLSPFVDDKAEGYVPLQRQVMEGAERAAAGKLHGGSAPAAVKGEEGAESDEDGEEMVQEREAQFLADLEEETGGGKGKQKKRGREEEKEAEIPSLSAAAGAAVGDGEEDADGEEEEDAEEDSEEEEEEEGEGGDSDLDDDDDSSEEEEVAAAALAAPPAKKSRKEREEEEARERGKMMLPKKHRRLLQRIEFTAQQKQQRAEKLEEKRKQIAADKKKSSGKSTGKEGAKAQGKAVLKGQKGKGTGKRESSRGAV
uniref:Pescadillo homolog n=1 Tax=Chromera velia CCMP2878 TaxID=1169474 RepID=A0A0G4I3P0_9ALVE|eukprot:Cvel_10716.t1-p1 / transcript=Cvel_10716.t1 / gene=Cvel_10716 / organism=Chromera_velia_CCMP2878 / gene_product=Pescadillo homolog, putative / transcript_product=Pescadillo homolog, putative / location=Cvel_scaffold652:27161-33002(+) / protein_length=698 / sequence_SO=supercontig / SO=protein_coding / is_pseudo=false